MPKGSQFEDLARDAAERIEDARRMGEQLDLLPPDAPVAPEPGGRAPRGKGKATSQLRDWLAARGLRLPEDVLAEVAGLAGGGDAVLTAMAQAERILAWAADGAPAQAPTMRARLDVFQLVYAAQVRAAEALLPYGLAKVTPDQGNQVFNQFILPGAAAPAPADRVQDPAGQARDVTPQPRRIMPPPLPGEIQRNQQVAQAPAAASDGQSRTEWTKP